MTEQINNTVKQEYIPAYDGEDMAGYIMEKGFKLYSHEPETIKSIVNVRNFAIIVTDYRIYRAKPCHEIGFCIEVLSFI